MNPYIGDLSRDFIEAVYKCQYWDRLEPLGQNVELSTLLKSWCDYVIENWRALEQGDYKNLRERPLLNMKQLLTQQNFINNIPDLDKDQEIMMQVQKNFKKDANTNMRDFEKGQRNKTQEAKDKLAGRQPTIGDE